MSDLPENKNNDNATAAEPIKIEAITLHVNLKKGAKTAEIGKSSEASRTVSTILAGSSNERLVALKKEYRELSGMTLEEGIHTYTWGAYEDALLVLCRRKRMEDPPDEARLESDAEALYEAAYKKIGTSEEKLMDILCTRNREQIRAIKEIYDKKYSRSLETDIHEDTHGLFEDDNFGDLMMILLTHAPAA